MSTKPNGPFIASAVPVTDISVVQGTGFGVDTSRGGVQLGMGPVQQYYDINVQGGNLQTTNASGINYGFGSQAKLASSYVGTSGFGQTKIQQQSLFGVSSSKAQSSMFGPGGVTSTDASSLKVGGSSIYDTKSKVEIGPKGVSMDYKINCGGMDCVDLKCTNCCCCSSCTQLCDGLSKGKDCCCTVLGCLKDTLCCVISLASKARP